MILTALLTDVVVNQTLFRTDIIEALPGVLWIQGEGLSIFMGFGEKGHLFSEILGESITFWGFREQGAEKTF